MFSLNSLLLLIAITYSFFRLEWSTNPNQVPYKLWFLNKKRDDDDDDVNGENKRSTNCLLDFFNKDHLIDSVKAIIKPRANHGRIYLIALIFSMGLYTFQRGKFKKIFFVRVS